MVLFDASGCGLTSRLHKVNAQSVFSSQVPLDKVTVDFRLWAAPLQDISSKSPTTAPPPESPPPPRRHDGTSSWNFETQLPMAFASSLGPRNFGEVAAAIVLYNAADRTSYTTAMACVKAARDAAGVDGDEICTAVIGIEAMAECVIEHRAGGLRVACGMLAAEVVPDFMGQHAVMK